MTDLRTAAQQALDYMKSVGQIDMYPEEWAIVGRLEAALAQEQVKPEQPLRSEFEAWAASYSTFSLERDDNDALGTTGYKSLEQTMLWHAWCAAKTNAPEGASEGESGANAQLGLADGDCTHKFAIAPSSGISICTECGLSEFVAQKRAALAQEQAEPYAGKAARINNDRIQVDPVTGDVSIGTPQTTEPAQEPWGTRERFYEAIDRAVENMREDMRVKTVTMRLPEYDITMPIIDAYSGHVLVGPVVPVPPQRKPLTDEEIIDVVRDADLDWAKGWTLDEMQGNRFATLARAIERAHGIGGQE